MTATPPPTRRRGPGIRAPFFTALFSLFAAFILALASVFMAGPDFLKLYKELSNGGSSDVETITALIQSIVPPGVALLGMVTALAASVFVLAVLWLLVALVIRLCRL